MKRKEKFESENGFEAWGDYMGAKISKLEDQFRQNAANTEVKESDLFAGISIFVNGYTNPSADELKRLMMQHGGIFHHYKRPTTTYVIATNLPDVKVKSITSDVILSPQWVVDCIKLMRIVDHKKYLLYTNHKPSQPKLAFGRLDKNVDIQKPVAKSDDQNDISTNDFRNLMSKLHVLNEQIKVSSANNLGISQESVEASHVQNNSANETKVAEMEALIVSESANETDVAEMEKLFLSESPEKDANDDAEHVSLDNQHLEHTVSAEPVDESIRNIRTSLKATDPNFLTEFFNNSRLHHIATLGAGFKQYVGELRESHNGTFPERETLKKLISKSDELGARGPFVMHIDMDCFFVSVGLRKYPHLRGQPVAVTHSKGSDAGKMHTRPGQNRSLEIEMYQKRLEERYKTPDIPYESRLLNIDDNNSMSEIASCSYEARKMGVKNGMFVGSALKLCPNMKTIPYDFEGYKEVAFMLYNTLAKYTLNIEAVSCDEMFVELTDLINDTGVNVMDFVSYVRTQIKDATGCPCSAGVGANRLQARMATKKAKPNGQYYLVSETVLEYMRDIPIADLPGIGPSTNYRLKQMSLTTCGDLQKVSNLVLLREFGKKFGDTISQACLGIDERPLVYEKVRKSVSVDVNYGIRFKEDAEVERFMKQLSEEIHKRLSEIKKRGKLVTVKLLIRTPEAPVETAKFMGHGLCDIITKSCPLKEYTCDLHVIENTVLKLMKQIAAPPNELRGIGLQISKFEDNKSNTYGKNSLKSMFEKVEAKNEAMKKDQMAKETINVSPTDKTKRFLVEPPSSKLEKTPTKNPSTSASAVTPKKTDCKPKISSAKFGRGRGRPPKHLTLSRSKQNNDLLRFLKDSKNEPKQDPIPKGLDPDVLAALPEEIRAEVIRDYKVQAKTSTSISVTQPKINDNQQPTTSSNQLQEESMSEKINVDLKFLQALPAELRQEVEKQIELQKDNMVVTSNEPEFFEHLQVTPEPSPVKIIPKALSCPITAPCNKEKTQEKESENILLRTEWRKLLGEWIESSEEPTAEDVDMISSNARELVLIKKLAELHLALRFLFRILQERKRCPWHQAYFRIVHTVQLVMREIYQTKLAVRSDFGCGNEDCCNIME